eukprot:1843572-Rhodomonas_salina.3
MVFFNEPDLEGNDPRAWTEGLSLNGSAEDISFSLSDESIWNLEASFAGYESNLAAVVEMDFAVQTMTSVNTLSLMIVPPKL